jgi:hypothetical protein
MARVRPYECAVDLVHTTLREQLKRGVHFFAIAG